MFLTSIEKGSLTHALRWLLPLFLIPQRVVASNHRKASTASRKPSLQLGDTPDGLRELGPLELMNRDLDPTGSLQLNRSMSTDSLSSISSIANNFGHDFTVGQLEVSLEHEARSGVLFISLLQGKDLLEKEEGDFPGCFIRVTLLPEELNVGVSRVRRPEHAAAHAACLMRRWTALSRGLITAPNADLMPQS